MFGVPWGLLDLRSPRREWIQLRRGVEEKLPWPHAAAGDRPLLMALFNTLEELAKVVLKAILTSLKHQVGSDLGMLLEDLVDPTTWMHAQIYQIYTNDTTGMTATTTTTSVTLFVQVVFDQGQTWNTSWAHLDVHLQGTCEVWGRRGNASHKGTGCEAFRIVWKRSRPVVRVERTPVNVADGHVALSDRVGESPFVLLRGLDHQFSLGKQS